MRTDLAHNAVEIYARGVFQRMKALFPRRNSDGMVVDSSERFSALRGAIEARFRERIPGRSPYHVSASVLTRGGRASLLSVALIAPDGDLQSALVVGSIRAEAQTATIKSFAQLVRDAMMMAMKG